MIFFYCFVTCRPTVSKTVEQPSLVTFEGMQLTAIVNKRRHSETCRANKWHSSISRSTTSTISRDVKTRFTCDVIDLSTLKYVNTGDENPKPEQRSLLHKHMGMQRMLKIQINVLLYVFSYDIYDTLCLFITNFCFFHACFINS